jgi:hypothetical protein
MPAQVMNVPSGIYGDSCSGSNNSFDPLINKRAVTKTCKRVRKK